MPILSVEIVSGPGQAIPGGLVTAIADAAGRVFKALPGELWVRLNELDHEHYAENGTADATRIFPVFVRVLMASLPPEAELGREASALATAIARACGRPVESVHIVYEPPAAGRIAFGGKLLGNESD